MVIDGIAIIQVICDMNHPLAPTDVWVLVLECFGTEYASRIRWQTPTTEVRQTVGIPVIEIMRLEKRSAPSEVEWAGIYRFVDVKAVHGCETLI